jgi:arylsulfatase A-like enzyme
VTEPRVDAGLIYQTDMSATVTELAGGECSPDWDGRSFAEAFRAGESDPRAYLVVGQCCWSVQRSVRWGDHMCLRTYHDGLHDWAPVMLFDVKDDPHEQHDLAVERPDLVGDAMTMLDRWHAEMMATSETGVDPMNTVLREGGPFHTRGMLEPYCAYLRKTGRAHHAETLEARHGRGT